LAWPEPDPVVASAVRKIFRGKDLPLAVAVRDEFGELFADGLFAEAFEVRGRPAWSPGRLALVTVLQKAENLTDRGAAAAVATRLDWRYALGLGLAEDGFDASVLSEFRTRVVEHHLEEAVLDALVGALAARGLVAAGGRQRTDSTHVVAAVRDLNRLELAGEAVRAALEAIAAAAPAWLAQVLDVPGWTARYELRVDSWRLPTAQAKRDALAVDYGRDAFALLAAVLDGPGPVWLSELPAVQALRVVALQNYTRTVTAEGQEVIRRRKAEPDGDGLPPAHIRLTSPYDLDARRSGKNGRFWTGYKLHVSETCHTPPGHAAGEPLHLITAVVTTTATVPDVAVTPVVHRQLHDRGLSPSRHYADSGYASAEALVAAETGYGITLVTPMMSDNSRQGRAAQGFAVDDFHFDFATGTTVCPGGKTSSSWSRARQRGKDKIVVQFATADCRPCPLRTACTNSKAHRRLLTIGTEEVFTARKAALAAEQTPAWRQDYKFRAGIEGTIDQIIGRTGSRRARYHGLPKTRADHITCATAINLVRWHAWSQGRHLHRTRTSHLTRLHATLTSHE
jgi:transposase